MASACPVSRNKAKCGFCKKEGHLEAACFGKYRKENARAMVADGGEAAGACWRACAEDVEHVSATCWLAGMNEQNASCMLQLTQACSPWSDFGESLHPQCRIHVRRARFACGSHTTLSSPFCRALYMVSNIASPYCIIGGYQQPSSVSG